jgi:hypothetical protein
MCRSHVFGSRSSSAMARSRRRSSYFHAFTRVRGTKTIAVESGQIDSGEIIEAQ